MHREPQPIDPAASERDDLVRKGMYAASRIQGSFQMALENSIHDDADTLQRIRQDFASFAEAAFWLMNNIERTILADETTRQTAGADDKAVA